VDTADRWNVGILIFDGVEVLDFAGPFEVFSRTRLTPGVESRRSQDGAPFEVFTVAKSEAPVSATGGLRVIPHYAFASAPSIDLLVVPGGFGTRTLLHDPETLEWIRRTATAARQVTSVCTGSLLLAKAGLLKGRRATTHWGALDHLESLGSGVVVERERRVVDDGIISSAGVASGIDMAFYVVERLFGADVANETARYIEYRRADGTGHGGHERAEASPSGGDEGRRQVSGGSRMGKIVPMLLWCKTQWVRCRALYLHASPAARVALAALLFVAFVTLIAYVNASAYLQKAARAKSGSRGPHHFVIPPVLVRPPATAPAPGPIPPPVKWPPVPPSPPPPAPAAGPWAPRLKAPGAAHGVMGSDRGNQIQWIHGDRD
jgi:putative intracellular protease/amidase